MRERARRVAATAATGVRGDMMLDIRMRFEVGVFVDRCTCRYRKELLKRRDLKSKYQAIERGLSAYAHNDVICKVTVLTSLCLGEKDTRKTKGAVKRRKKRGGEEERKRGERTKER